MDLPHELDRSPAPGFPDGPAGEPSSDGLEDRLGPALGAMIRLFCARFMPEVGPLGALQGAPPEEPLDDDRQ